MSNSEEEAQSPELGHCLCARSTKELPPPLETKSEADDYELPKKELKSYKRQHIEWQSISFLVLSTVRCFDLSLRVTVRQLVLTACSN